MASGKVELRCYEPCGYVVDTMGGAFCQACRGAGLHLHDAYAYAYTSAKKEYSTKGHEGFGGLLSRATLT